MKPLRPLLILLSVLFPVTLSAQNEVRWKLDKADFAAPSVVTIMGAPKLTASGPSAVMAFNGRDDGFAVAVNPVAGWRHFTVRAKFKPDLKGPEAQRFLHIEDAAGHRITMEIRLTTAGTWSLDTYLKNPEKQQQLTLLNKTLLHSAGEWHVATLSYDGKTMTSAVDGKTELSGPVDFPATGPGNTGIGVRLNRVSWFKGAIAELDFSSS